MRKLLYILTLGVLLASCELETSGNKELDGYWQMFQVDTLATGGVADTREALVYWGVQGDLLQIRFSENGKYLGEGFLFRFHQEEYSLTLSSPILHHLYETDEPVTDVEVLYPYGIFNLEEEFGIEELYEGRMVLNNGVLRLHFRKY
ncbi:MAG: lipocalin-like domain-containing protein [Prevotella sp.]|nr:lipocalin-like domain-containing protein [Prevotella sp.]MBQ9649118.1 lipocalin-like domain-containing protein [Prevotella sp.]